MSKTSVKNFPENFRKQIWKNFLKRIKAVKSEKEFIDAVKEIATANEITIMEKRLMARELLRSGFSYRKISEIVDIHFDTISFVKKGLKKAKRIKVKPQKQESILESLFGKRSEGIFPKYRGRRRSFFI